MKFLFALFLSAVAAAGCTTRTKARAEAQQAFLVGQNAALLKQLQTPVAGVTIVGPVQNPQVPWVEGLTLSQALTTANYLDSREPSEIILTRHGESARLDPKVLLNGGVVPLEAGDVVEIH